MKEKFKRHPKFNLYVSDRGSFISGKTGNRVMIARTLHDYSSSKYFPDTDESGNTIIISPLKAYLEVWGGYKEGELDRKILKIIDPSRPYLTVDNIKILTCKESILKHHYEFKYSRDVYVYVRDIRTGEVTKHHSQLEVGRWLDTTTSHIHAYLTSSRRYPLKCYYDLRTDNMDFVGFTEDDILDGIEEYGTVNVYYLQSVDQTRKDLVMGTVKDIAEYLNIKFSPSRITRLLNHQGGEVDGERNVFAGYRWFRLRDFAPTRKAKQAILAKIESGEIIYRNNPKIRYINVK